MGTPHYAKEILSHLIAAEDMNISLVISQPDRPVGRKKILTSPPVKILAEAYNINCIQPNRLTDDGIYDAIKELNPDFIVVAAFGQMLPKSILDIAPCINLHASLLPQYRGASPIQQSLLNGDQKSGVTSMMMEEGLDTGAILEVCEYKIPSDMRLSALTEQLTKDACVLTLSTIRNFKNITPIMQDEADATLCKKIKKIDGEVNFLDAIEVYDKYRAFEGWPGIFANNGTKLNDITLMESSSDNKPFTIVAFDEDTVIVACEKGTLKIGRLQPASKKEVSAKVFCSSRGLKVGNTLF